MLDVLAGPKASEDLVLLRLQLGRDQRADALTEDLVNPIPKIRSAPAFQLVIVPSRSFDTIASLEASTTAPRYARRTSEPCAASSLAPERPNRVVEGGFVI